MMSLLQRSQLSVNPESSNAICILFHSFTGESIHPLYILSNHSGQLVGGALQVRPILLRYPNDAVLNVNLRNVIVPGAEPVVRVIPKHFITGL